MIPQRILRIKQFSTQNLFQSLEKINSLKSRIAGSSKENWYETYRNYNNSSIDKIDIPGITIVRSRSHAQKVVQILQKYPERVHAWDTETVDIDLKTEGPLGNGKIICASVFCGPDIDFGNGPRLFIDNFAQNADNILIFKNYLENKMFLKIWHNYSFDRHIFMNHGINVQGFGGDTMHLARLYDPSLQPNQYSLANQTTIHEKDIQDMKESIVKGLEENPNTTPKQKEILKQYREHLMNINIKRSLTSIFGVQRNETSKTLVYPSILQMHCRDDLIKNWIEYSSLDAEATFFLFYSLANLLRDTPVVFGQPNAVNEYGIKNQLDIYKKYWQPFGEILTDMERKGFAIDLNHAKSIEEKAILDIQKLRKEFKEWVQSIQPTDQTYFNCNSLLQLQQLIYGPWDKDQPQPKLKDHKDNIQQQQTNLKKNKSKNENSDNFYDIEYDSQTTHEEEQYYSDGRKIPIRKDITKFPLTREFKVENEAYDKINGQPRMVSLFITGLGIKPLQFTSSGMPSCDTAALKELVGKKQQDGTYSGSLFKDLYNDDENNLKKAIEACQALTKLIELRGLEVLYGTFISPLSGLASKKNRINCNLNINTETGRLSSRNPNMQNQPALEKDKYQIRKCFVAEKGKQLIVADYGQLELRVLAHMTNCQTMIDAFVLGGDFHSRTAISMFPYIKDEIDKGQLLLEWDKSKGEAPAPLLKEKYAAERRKAKTMNFSIAYGKTQTGFAREWGVSGKEAQKVINQWYKERQEVKFWQKETKECAVRYGFTQTLIGRYRWTTKYFESGMQDRYYWHGLRASINTPIQGGAADIVIAAMVRIAQDERLKQLGWELVLQVHDELILEGPEESSKEALDIVKDRMENPFESIKLRLKLEVDAKIGINWYECK